MIRVDHPVAFQVHAKELGNASSDHQVCVCSAVGVCLLERAHLC